MELVQDVAIEIKELKKSYPGRDALKNISFQVKKGSIHGFLGPNGAGKSTTMKILCGLVKETAGNFVVDGRIGFLPEHPPLYPHMSVRDYLLFVLELNANLPSSLKEQRLEEVLHETGLQEVTSRLIGNLSKGFQQRVGIAQAIIHRPDIIILDEPTVGLDPVALAEIRKLILSLKKNHTILFSSHQLHEVELLCSDITLVNLGEVVVTGSLEKIKSSLKTGTMIKAIVKKITSEQVAELKKIFKLSHFTQIHSEEKNETLLEIRGDFDRADLARFLAVDSIGLLSFLEESPDLETLFLNMEKKR